MLESVSRTAVSFDTARSSKTGAVPRPSGNVVPDAGKISPAQAASIAKLNLDQVVEQLNLVSASIGRTLRFKVDVVSGHSVIQVLDRDTGELIREIPPEKAVVTLTEKNAALGIQLLDDMV